MRRRAPPPFLIVISRLLRKRHSVHSPSGGLLRQPARASPLRENCPPVVVRADHPVELRPRKRTALGTLLTEVGPHGLFRTRFHPAPGRWSWSESWRAGSRKPLRAPALARSRSRRRQSASRARSPKGSRLAASRRSRQALATSYPSREVRPRAGAPPAASRPPGPAATPGAVRPPRPPPGRGDAQAERQPDRVLGASMPRDLRL